MLYWTPYDYKYPQYLHELPPVNAQMSDSTPKDTKLAPPPRKIWESNAELRKRVLELRQAYETSNSLRHKAELTACFYGCATCCCCIPSCLTLTVSEVAAGCFYGCTFRPEHKRQYCNSFLKKTALPADSESGMRWSVLNCVNCAKFLNSTTNYLLLDERIAYSKGVDKIQKADFEDQMWLILKK